MEAVVTCAVLAGPILEFKESVRHFQKEHPMMVT